MTHTADFAAVTMLHLTGGAPFTVAAPQHPGLQEWSKALRRLRFALRDLDTEAPAERLRAMLYSARLHAVTSTLPLNHPLIWDQARDAEARTLSRSLEAVAPEVPALVDEMLRLLRLMHLFATNPVFSAVQADLDERRARPRPRPWPGYDMSPERWVMVVRPAAQAAMQVQWAHEPELAVLTPQDMTGDRVFEHAYFLGSAQRYPAALLANPRALSATLYRYGFIYDEDLRRPVTELLRDHEEDPVAAVNLPLLPEVGRVEWRPPQPMPALPDESAAAPEPLLGEPGEAEDLVWEDERSPDKGSTDERSPEVPVAAVTGQAGLLREVVIATEQGQDTVWLDEGLTTPRLHTSYPPSVEAVTGATVEVGDVLLLRTEGTQLAYSRDLARTEFGEAYLRASRVHAEFNLQLNAAVKAAGSRREAVKLIVRAGADRSCTMSNLSQWMKTTHFRPDSEATYAALLTFIGWTERRGELDDAIHLLRASHIYAGRRAGEERLKLLLKLDFERLAEKGYLEVELGGGKVGAHRVLRVGTSKQP